MIYVNDGSYGFHRESDIEKLRMFSPIACKNSENDYYLLEFDTWNCKTTPDDFGCFDVFHPQNNSGVIQLRDECMFGLRCDHLVYIDGFSCVYGIYVYKDSNFNKQDELDEFNKFIEEHQKDELDSVLLLANHKGNLVLRLIIFKK